MTFFSVLALVAGFAMLVWGADQFVDAASQFALRLGIPAVVVGLTVVALGTSAPEAAISITSSLHAADELTIANVLGSNIMNTLVILGLTALFVEVPVSQRALRREIPFVVAITVLFLVLCMSDGMMGRGDAIIFLVLLTGYLIYLVHTSRNPEEIESESGEEVEISDTSMPVLVAKGVLGAILIAWGADLAVSGASDIALALGMSERLIGLTIVAFGTSLPELVTSVTAATKGQSDIAVGNIVGSSILNLLFVLGISSAISPIPFALDLVPDAVVAILATVMLWALTVRSHTLNRVGGLAMLAAYGVYLAHLIIA